MSYQAVNNNVVFEKIHMSKNSSVKIEFKAELPEPKNDEIESNSNLDAIEKE